jgi:hypothetical protein
MDLGGTSSVLVPASLLSRLQPPRRGVERPKQASRESEADATTVPVPVTPPGINLARTSLASVTVTSVNAGREADNKYYGIQNAFDDGANWHNNINYTYWLSNPGDLQPRVEVAFVTPLEISAVVVEGGPRYSVMFVDSAGNERHAGPVSSVLQPDQVVTGVSKVRLTFLKGEGNVQAGEIRVLGPRPQGVTFTVGRPPVALLEQGPTSRSTGRGRRVDRHDDG